MVDCQEVHQRIPLLTSFMLAKSSRLRRPNGSGEGQKLAQHSTAEHVVVCSNAIHRQHSCCLGALPSAKILCSQPNTPSTSRWCNPLDRENCQKEPPANTVKMFPLNSTGRSGECSNPLWDLPDLLLRSSPSLATNRMLCCSLEQEEPRERMPCSGNLTFLYPGLSH